MRDQKRWAEDLGFPEKPDSLLAKMEDLLKRPEEQESITKAEKFIIGKSRTSPRNSSSVGQRR